MFGVLTIHWRATRRNGPRRTSSELLLPSDLWSVHGHVMWVQRDVHMQIMWRCITQMVSNLDETPPSVTTSRLGRSSSQSSSPASDVNIKRYVDPSFRWATGISWRILPQTQDIVVVFSFPINLCIDILYFNFESKWNKIHCTNWPPPSGCASVFAQLVTYQWETGIVLQLQLQRAIKLPFWVQLRIFSLTTCSIWATFWVLGTHVICLNLFYSFKILIKTAVRCKIPSLSSASVSRPLRCSGSNSCWPLN